MKKEKSKLPLLYKEDSRRPANSYSREYVCRSGIVETTFSIYGDANHWTAFQDSYTLTVMGPSQFWKKVGSTQCTYKDKKLYGNIEPFVNKLLGVFHIDWMATNRWTLKVIRGRKDLWVRVLSGKITNPEALCKAFSRKYFKGAFSYSSLRKCAEEQAFSVPLWDLYYYCTNPEAGLRLILQDYIHVNRTLMYDVQSYCKILNSKWDPKWSQKRMHQEHQKQIELLNTIQLESKDSAPIASSFSKDGLSLILNERDCYAEGCSMHNCVHSCYWARILNGTYLIARGEVNGEYVDLGMSVEKDDIKFNQVHTRYNGTVLSDTQNICMKWIEDNKKILLATVAEIKKCGAHKVTEPEYLVAPF